MTRTAQHTPTRPPTRRGPRRPGTSTPRGQAGGTPRTTPVAEVAEGAEGSRNTVVERRPGTGTPPTGPGAPGSGPGRNAGRTAAPGNGRRASALGRGGAPTTPESVTGRDAVSTSPPRTAGQGTHPASRPAEPHTVLARTAPTAPTTRTARTAPTAQAAQAAARARVPQPRPTDVFADRLLAVLSGQRPVHWMLRHTAGPAYDELIRLAEHGPLRATRGVRPVVRDIGYYVARPGAVEAFARIGAGDQVRAMAFRLEQGADLRWRCTAVELGGPRAPHQDDD
ncbi:Rv3235 family protein [Streptomyces sp. NPDC091219]|uniref:Rv3235 family protein n=1 Tax=Streptomyces sp. NPDC091219 TaxID=3155193 RepID=UPI00345106EF